MRDSAFIIVIGICLAAVSGHAEPQPLVTDARVVLDAIRMAVISNRNVTAEHQLSGDALTVETIRQAATAAATVPDDRAGTALLVGLSIGLDNGTTLTDNPLFRDRLDGIESPEERHQRVAALGNPTLDNRRDLALHFAVSMGLAVLVGPEVAEALGVAKEMHDARAGSGFSFRDFAANLAGIELARHVLDGRLTPEKLASDFTVSAYVPTMDGLPEGLSIHRFLADYGSIVDDRFRDMRALILDRISSLPGYSD